MSERVFVYGTLMHGQPNHHVLAELGARAVRAGATATTAAAATAAPRTLLDLGPYPALLAADAAEGRPATRVIGELYDLPGDALDALDAFEEVPDLYRRERIAVEQDGATEEAWTYVLAGNPPPHARVLTTGRYAAGTIVRGPHADEADTLDKRAEISDVSPPRKPR
jgi:gamma-glutamylaminecyclotransferase